MLFHFFNESRLSNGYIKSKDRDKKNRNFPLTGIAIAGVYGQLGNFKNPEELASYITKIKKMVKEYEKSNYMIKDLKTNTTHYYIKKNRKGSE